MKQHSLLHSITICEVKLEILMETHELLGRLPVWRNKHRSWTVLHSHLSYWWTVMMIFFCFASFRFCFILFRFCFVSFRFCLFRFASFLFRFLFYNHPWKGDSASKLSSLSMDKESGLVKRKWFTNIVRIFCTYFAFTSFDSERIKWRLLQK